MIKSKYLFLCPEFVYPPTKGEKIPFYQIIKSLGSSAEITLICFASNKPRQRHIDFMANYCQEIKIFYLPNYIKYCKAILALLFNQPIGNFFYFSFQLRKYLSEKLHFEKFDYFLIYGSNLASYFKISNTNKNLKRISCMDDLDSYKWTSYAAKAAFPLRLFWQREARLLFHHECKVIENADKTIFINMREKLKLKKQQELFNKFINRQTIENKVIVRTPAVDHDYFSPNITYLNPFQKNEKVIVFCGTMNYPPNFESVIWFAKYVFPLIIKTFPRAKFYICGQNPVSSLKNIANKTNIFVTGKVKDIRPYLHHSQVVVMPIFTVFGVQNKLLESMSMAKRIITTPAMYESLDITMNWKPIISYNPAHMARMTLDLLTRETTPDYQAREIIKKYYDYSRNSLNLINNLKAR